MTRHNGSVRTMQHKDWRACLQEVRHDIHVLRREAHVDRGRVLQRVQVPPASAHEVVDLRNHRTQNYKRPRVAADATHTAYTPAGCAATAALQRTTPLGDASIVDPRDMGISMRSQEDGLPEMLDSRLPRASQRWAKCVAPRSVISDVRVYLIPWSVPTRWGRRQKETRTISNSGLGVGLGSG